MRQLSILTAIALVLIFGATATAAPIMIDNFNTSIAGGNFVGTGSSANGSFAPFGPSPGNILGTRTITYTRVPAGNFATAEAISVNTVADPGVLFFATSTSAVEVEAAYSGFGLLSLLGGTLNIEFSPVFDLGSGSTPFEVQVVLGTTSGALVLSFPVPVGFVPNGGTLSIPLSGLVGPGDISNVNSIAIRFNDGGTPRTSSDFVINGITLEVPEPATLAICGAFGIAGLIGARRKLRKVAEPTTAA